MSFADLESQESLILFWTKLQNSGHSEWGLRFLGGFLIKKVDYYTSHRMAYVIIRRSTGSFLLFWGKNMHKYVIQQRYSKVVIFSSRIASFYKYINMINGYGKGTLLFKNYYSLSGFNEPILYFIAALSFKNWNCYSLGLHLILDH